MLKENGITIILNPKRHVLVNVQQQRNAVLIVGFVLLIHLVITIIIQTFNNKGKIVSANNQCNGKRL